MQRRSSQLIRCLRLCCPCQNYLDATSELRMHAHRSMVVGVGTCKSTLMFQIMLFNSKCCPCKKYVDAISELKMHVQRTKRGLSHDAERDDGHAECIMLRTAALPITAIKNIQVQIISFQNFPALVQRVREIVFNSYALGCKALSLPNILLSLHLVSWKD